MKIRSTYVSNSSSSSFVIFGDKITDPLASLKKGKRVFVFVPGGGTSGEAEDWGMFLDEECFNLLNDSSWFKERKKYSTFIECPEGFDEDPEEVDKVIITKEIKNQTIFAFNRDYSSPNTLEGLKEFLEEE